MWTKGHAASLCLLSRSSFLPVQPLLLLWTYTLTLCFVASPSDSPCP